MVLEYLIKSAFVLTLMYGCFAWLLRRETFHRLNRVLLLSILGASLLLPLVQIRPAIMLEVDTPTYLTQATEFFATPAIEQPEAPQVEESGSESPVTVSEEYSAAPAPEHAGGPFLRHLNVRACLMGIYLLGLGVVLVRLLLELRQLIASLRGGMRLRDPSGATLVVRSASFPPYSFFRCIVVSVEDYEQNREPVLTHEQAHVRLGHSWDILLLQVVQAVQWFNPFVWMMGQDLRALHEYEADEAVLNPWHRCNEISTASGDESRRGATADALQQPEPPLTQTTFRYDAQKEIPCMERSQVCPPASPHGLHPDGLCQTHVLHLHARRCG